MALSEKQITEIKRRRREQNRHTIKRSKKPKVPQNADPIFRKYRNTLNKEYVDPFIEFTRQIIFPKLDDIVAEAKASRPDSARVDSWMDDLNNLLDNLNQTIDKNTPQAKSIASDIGKETSDFNRNEFKAVMASVLDVPISVDEPWLDAELGAFVSQNTDLIKSIPQQGRDRVKNTILTAVRNGRAPDDIRDQLENDFGITRRRAKNIANDQINKLNGSLTQLRQQEAGIEKYEWNASLDERTRDSHRRNHGKIFSWNDPPSTGHVGIPINCRCTARPVMDELVERVKGNGNTS